MAALSVPNPETVRNEASRRTMVRQAVWRRVSWQRPTPTRAYVAAAVAWRLGDTPADLPPSPADFGLSDAQGAAWNATIDSWLAEALAEIGGAHA